MIPLKRDTVALFRDNVYVKIWNFDVFRDKFHVISWYGALLVF